MSGAFDAIGDVLGSVGSAVGDVLGSVGRGAKDIISSTPGKIAAAIALPYVASSFLPAAAADAAGTAAAADAAGMAAGGDIFFPVSNPWAVPAATDAAGMTVSSVMGPSLDSLISGSLPIAGAGATLADITSGALPFLSGSSPLISSVINPAAAGAGAAAGASGGPNVFFPVNQPLPGMGVETPAVPDTSSGGGILSTIGKAAGAVEDFMKKHPLATLGASTLIGSAMAPKVQPLPEIQPLSSQQEMASQMGQKLVSQATSGTLTPAQQAAVEQWRNQQYNEAKQYLASSGQGTNSTAWLDIKAKIDAQAEAMKSGLLNQTFAQGTKLLGLSDSEATTLMNARLMQDQLTQGAFGDLVSAFMRGLPYALS